MESRSSSEFSNTSLTELNRDHIAELNSARPKQPFFFLKPSSSILPPQSGPVLRPRGVKLHYEVELALIMAREVRDLDANDEDGAMDAIEGLSEAAGKAGGNGGSSVMADENRILLGHRYDGPECPGRSKEEESAVVHCQRLRHIPPCQQLHLEKCFTGSA